MSSKVYALSYSSQEVNSELSGQVTFSFHEQSMVPS